MIFRPLLACLAVTWLAGCELLPEQPRSTAQSAAEPSVKACHAVIPDFDDEACLLPDWVAFGLASQRGERGWREVMLGRLEGETKEQRLARAVVLAWGNESQWDRAAELLKADLHTAPSALQPLLRYWLNEVEGRRAMAGRVASTRGELAAMEEENEALAEKLEALTAIEQNINLRQQTDDD
ncbi:hypothetical protein [Halomonas heilongjiangensis]|uniref:YfhG lipoprotein n=1 Tax=Halomonas heilongjiangensis TaxID=1387883 RepID=A0A2N7TS33_9GAMM|nr:hypothetical protein [Halomonas heilongjiangensis]PMR70997.1 hypothetical protein C1H66_04285 [Halomonas heilongjiangensis]PXX91358.1 hypothetical protein CR158_07540 [Halomonas heilongjiangensis]